MKKMLLATALARLLQDVLNRRLLFQTNQRQCRAKAITHHFFVSIGQKKTVDAAKICGGAENVDETETNQTFVNGLLGFITDIYTPLEAHCVLLTIITWNLPHRYGQLYLHCSLIYGFLPVVFVNDQPLSLRVK